MSDIRSSVPTNKPARRALVVKAFEDVLRAAPFDSDSPTGPKLFDVVKKGTIDDLTRMETPGCALEEGVEEPIHILHPFIDNKLRLFFNIKIIPTVGVDPNPLITYYFGRIIELFVTEQHLANLVTSISEAGNSIQSHGLQDPEPGGTLWLDVEYRSYREEPFRS